MVEKVTHITDPDVIGDLLQPMDKDAPFVSGDNNYVWFYSIGRYYKPKKIVEMGTRFGYSMKAFIMGAGWSSYCYSLYSYDLECDGIKTLDIFENYFRNNLGIKDLHINKVDTSALSSLGVSSADLCLVDGYHTTEGCYHECELGYESLKVGGVLVVDDVNYDFIRIGVERFCNERNLSYTYLPSLNGIYLIEKI